MKTDTPRTMTTAQINRRIAETCGNNSFENVTNYHGDLNAMHEAEKWMMDNKSLQVFWNYAEFLQKHFLELGIDGFLHATSSQRAEAFLRAIGKWEDGK